MAGNFVRKSLRLAIYVRDSFSCIYCGMKVDPLLVRSDGTHPELELDHLVPQIQGGGHEPENLMSCCQRCNDGKFKWSLDDFLDSREDLVRVDVLRRVYLARRRRIKRARTRALELMKMLAISERARCPWCEDTCRGCFESLAKVELLHAWRDDGYDQGEDQPEEDGLLEQEEGRDQESVRSRG